MATACGAAGAVLLLRGESLAVEAAWLRTRRRGRRWYDIPLNVLSFPWYVLKGLPGSLLLMAFAGVLAAGTAAALMLAGVPDPDALVVTGLVLGLAAWVGPGSTRVRDPLRRGATALAEDAVVGWLFVATAVALCVVLLLARDSLGVQWGPLQESPSQRLQDVGPLGATL
jgi:hypothetical protein